MEAKLRTLKKQLSEALNIDLDCYKAAPVERQLRRSEAYFSEVLRNNPDPTEIASRILIGVSGFFRDPQEFDRLRRLVIPVLAQKPAPRVLSVGCADGSELYSVAMLLAEHAALQKSFLLGLDCNPKILAVARSRILSQKDKEQLPHRFQATFLKCEGPGRWTVVTSIHDRVHFELANVLDHPLAGTWDLILCRNLLIYLLPATQTQLLEKCRIALNDNGFLMLGRAERIISAQAQGWENLSSHLYRKVAMDRTGQC